MGLEDARTEVDAAFVRTDLRGLTFENAFGGAASFLRRRYSKEYEETLAKYKID